MIYIFFKCQCVDSMGSPSVILTLVGTQLYSAYSICTQAYVAVGVTISMNQATASASFFPSIFKSLVIIVLFGRVNGFKIKKFGKHAFSNKRHWVHDISHISSVLYCILSAIFFTDWLISDCWMFLTLLAFRLLYSSQLEEQFLIQIFFIYMLEKLHYTSKYEHTYYCLAFKFW